MAQREKNLIFAKLGKKACLFFLVLMAYVQAVKVHDYSMSSTETETSSLELATS